MEKSEKKTKEVNLQLQFIFYKAVNSKKEKIFWFFDILKEFIVDLKESRSDEIYSSGNWGVIKGPGSQGMRDGELFVPSLL